MRCQGADQFGVEAGLLLDLPDRARFDALVELDSAAGQRPDRVQAVLPAVEPAEEDFVVVIDDDLVTGKSSVIFGEVHDLTLPASTPVTDE